MMPLAAPLIPSSVLASPTMSFCTTVDLAVRSAWLVAVLANELGTDWPLGGLGLGTLPLPPLSPSSLSPPHPTNIVIDRLRHRAITSRALISSSPWIVSDR